MKNIFSIGHKNPDTDSIIASIIFCEFIKKLKKPIAGFSTGIIKAVRAGELNNETKFVLKYFKQTPPLLMKNLKNKKVILIDHGDYEQAVGGIENAEIIGVIDHHKLGGIKTAEPIFYRAEPVGSTSTIIAKIFLENNLSFNKKTAGLLLAGILSDTLNLTSPTTTGDDKKIVKILNKIAKENISAFSRKMFEAKSDISGISPAKIVSSDYKEFKAGEINFGIGVWETTSPQKVKEIKNEIFDALNKLKKVRNMDLMFFVLVDIFKRNSEIFILGEKEKTIAEKVFRKEVKNNLLFLPGVVSRKKEILPPLLKFFEKNEIGKQ